MASHTLAAGLCRGATVLAATVIALGALSTPARGQASTRATQPTLSEREPNVEISTSRTKAAFDPRIGVVQSLVHVPSGVEFAGNADNNPRFRVPVPPLLGHVRLRVASWGGPWRIEETRCSTAAARVETDSAQRRIRVAYEPSAAQDCGLRSVRLTEEWTLPAGDDAGAALQWRIRIEHAGDPDPQHAQPVRIGELSLPLALNTHFGGHGDQDLIYDRRVMMHSFVCGHSGYVLAQRLGGQPPILVLVPTPDTPLEAMAHAEGEFGAGEGWDGLVSVFCWSAASAELLGWKSWYHGHREIVLAPGEAREIGFDLHWAQDDREVERILDREGLLVFRSHPGYALPINHPCVLRIGGRARETIDTVQGDAGCRVTALGERGAARLYRVEFDTLGEHVVTVRYGGGRWTNILYNVLPDAREHLLTRARFIVEQQYFRQPGHRMDHAFMMWDAQDRRPVIEAEDVPWLVGGSDEGGLAEPLVLSTKNACAPDPREVAVLEEYVDQFCFGVLQKKDDYGIRNWVQHTGDLDAGWAGKTNRSFNYPHVWNIYFFLYRTGRLYGLTRVRTPEQYLELAYRTALAYFTLPMHKEHNITKGNMGEDTLGELIAALEAEGRADWARELRGRLQRKIEYMTRLKNPYLSELNFDTTGYAGAYFCRRLGGDDAGAQATLDVIVATRGRQPGWPWFASDVRWGWGNSKFRCGDEICFNYMAGQNAHPLLDAFEHTGRQEYLRLGYAALLAVWVLVEPDGTAHDFYGWEPARRRYDPWSSEMGHALVPAIHLSKAYVMDDEQLGLIGYGCRVERGSDGALTVTPLDAVRQRIWVGPLGVEVGVDRGTVAQARFADGGRRIELQLRPALSPGHPANLRLSGKGVAARYAVRVDGRPANSMTRETLAGALEIDVPQGGIQVVLSSQ
jgi:hypothetical protein